MAEESQQVADPVGSPALSTGDGGKVATVEAAGAAEAKAGPATPDYRASIYTAPNPVLPAEFAERVQSLEKNLKMPVWLIIQNDHESPYGHLGPEVAEGFFKARKEFKQSGPVALLIHSPGGSAYHAYRIAKTLRDHSGGFTAVVPRYAKSAATLLALGGDPMLPTKDAELGPLDAQHFDLESEELRSALDEVQALERLHATALEAIDRTVLFMKFRSGKKLDTILPTATSFVSDMMQPLLEKIDTVHYSQMQRMLKETEDYATRLLQPRHSERQARTIARHLVEKYSEHSFLIDAAELAAIGLRNLATPSDEQVEILDALVPHLDELTVIGRLEEVSDR